VNRPTAGPTTPSALDRPTVALWFFTAFAALDVVLYLGGPRLFGLFARGAVVATLHVGLASLAAFALYGFDKYRAGRGGRRVAESTLLLMAFTGGAPGAAAGMSLFRHKTQKPLFKLGIPLALFAHVVILGWIWLS
jgi:uncharacterized membrane protein YsdA (DUF1294 family)